MATRLITSKDMEITNAFALDNLKKELFPGKVVENTYTGINLKKSLIKLDIPADSLSWYHKVMGDIIEDTIALFDSTGIPIGKLTVQYENLFPKRLTYKSSNGQIKVTSEYSGYRINEAIPEETFRIDYAR